MWRKPGNSDIKSTRIYIWRRWFQSVNGWGTVDVNPNSKSIKAHFPSGHCQCQPDGWASSSPSLCLCLFHPWYKPRCFWSMMEGPNQGTKDVVRHPDQCHIWWIWWPLVRILHSYLGIRCGRWFHWDPSVSSSLLGRPHRVKALSSDPMDVAQGIWSWLWLDCDIRGLSVLWERHGCDSSHHGNDPAAFRRLATQPSR